MIDLVKELRAALVASRDEIGAVVREVVREELLRVPHDPDRLLTVDEAAQILSMTPNAIRRAVDRGTFPSPVKRLGRRLRFRLGDLLQSGTNQQGRQIHGI
jgi:predicted DNA-binding transcriptional regulator AlpA